MTFTNDEMFSNIELLMTLNEKGKLGYALARNLRKLKEACHDYIVIRGDVFKQYGRVIDEQKGLINIESSILDRELKDIRDIEHDVDVFFVDEEDFINSALTSNQMEQLLWMVKCDE